jgi:enoyl-CoA hydratase/carnithine racemase
MSVAEALDQLGHGLDTDDWHPLADRAVLLVDLAGSDAEVVDQLGTLTRHLPCVTVGVDLAGDTPDAVGAGAGFDVLFSSDPAAPRPWVGSAEIGPRVQELAAAVAASPLAAVALAQLLRTTESSGVLDAIVAESWVYSMLQAGDRFAAWRRDLNPPRPRIDSAVAVLVSRSGTTLEVELDRPHVHNALNISMRDGLIEALRIVVADESITRVRLSGRGTSFCSGGDLAEFGLAPDPVTAHVVRVSRSVGAWLSRCAGRVEVDLHGTCVGAGVEIPAFAGVVRARPGTVLSLPEVSMGLVPGAGGTASIPRRIGRHRTAYMALTGAGVGAPKAREWGLVDTVTDG